jgi:DNA-directed RNA polymerase beta' subunit
VASRYGLTNKRIFGAEPTQQCYCMKPMRRSIEDFTTT